MLRVAPSDSGLSADYYTDGQNDQIQINQAINALTTDGGAVLLLQGTYVIESQIILKSNISLVGEGIGKTILQGASTLGTHAIIENYGELAIPLEDILVTDIEFDGSLMPVSPWNTARKAIFMQYLKRCIFQNLYIHDIPATGLGTDFMVDCIIDNVITEACGTVGEDPGGNGIGIGTGKYEDENLIISNCITKNGNNNGILIEAQGSNFSSKHILIQNCHSYGNLRGFRVSGASNIKFEGNEVYDNTQDGIFLELYNTLGCRDIKILNNTILENGDNGIQLDSETGTSRDIIISGNNINTNTGYGILSRWSNVKINDNIIHTNAKSAILQKKDVTGTSSNIDISDNQCYNNGTAGVSLTNEGIEIYANAGDIDNVSIRGNTCFDDQGTKTQKYGVALRGNGAAEISNCIVENNDLEGNLTQAIFISTTGDGVVVRKNNGSDDTHNATVVTVANTGTKTTLGTHSIPANTINKNAMYRIRAMGVISTDAIPGTLAITIDLNTVNILTATQTPTAGITNKLWQLDALISIPTIGSSGEVEGQGIFKHFASDILDIDWQMVNTGRITKNITALCNLVLSADWQTADTDNSISIREFSVEKIQ